MPLENCHILLLSVVNDMRSDLNFAIRVSIFWLKMKTINNCSSLLQTFKCFLLVLIFNLTRVYSFHDEGYLNGKHLIVSGLSSLAGFNTVRNSTGHIIKYDGLAAHMLTWLSQRYNFTYSIFQINETALDTSGSQLGLIYHLLNDNCQLLFSVAATGSRIPLLDFTQPNLYVPVSYLILKPEISINIASIAYSFQTVVWLALAISILCVGAALSFISYYVDTSYGLENIANPIKKPWKSVSSYVTGVLLAQGGYLPLKSMPFYLIAGVWCLAAFILVNAYNSTLISQLTLPNQKPIINSIYDLRNRSDIHLITDRNLNTDAVLTSAESGFLKYLGDRLRSYPKSRCNSTKQCIELVKTGTHVYSSGVYSFLYGAMKEDFRATGKCNLQLQADSYMNLPISLGLPKRSKLTMIINKGIMEMREKGLLDEWAARSQPNARQCLVKNNKHAVKNLSLKDISGAFVVLSFGIFVSFLVFIGERILFCKQQVTKKKRDLISSEQVKDSLNVVVD